MGRYLTVRVLDTSSKDLLNIGHPVKVELHETFHDVLDRVLRSAATGRTLLSVKLREFENSPAAEGISLDTSLLDQSLQEIDEILEQQWNPKAGFAILVVSLQAAAPAPVGGPRNAFALLATAGKATYQRSQTVTDAQVRSWFSGDTDKSKLAQTLQRRLQLLGAGFFSTEGDSLRKTVFTRVLAVFWSVTPKLRQSFASDLGKAGQSVRAAI
jgi:hypothetical protein